jgi:hypothetical protein
MKVLDTLFKGKDTLAIETIAAECYSSEIMFYDYRTGFRPLRLDIESRVGKTQVRGYFEINSFDLMKKIAFDADVIVRVSEVERGILDVDVELKIKGRKVRLINTTEAEIEVKASRAFIKSLETKIKSTIK